jgi:Na+-transporting methylmalonyl-CoA/oxaloacetate decarboxylase gamma subunit
VDTNNNPQPPIPSPEPSPTNPQLNNNSSQPDTNPPINNNPVQPDSGLPINTNLVQPFSPAPPIPAVNNIQTGRPGIPKLFLGIGMIFLVLFIVVPIVIYLTLISPRLKTVKIIDEIKPQISNLKLSTKSVRAVVERIHFLTTEEINLQNSPAPETSKIIKPSRLAQSDDQTAVLGTSSTRPFSIVENSILQFSQDLNGFVSNMFSTDKNIAGIKTAKEDVLTEKYRQLKDETLKADEYLAKAQNDLSLLMAKSASSAKGMPKSSGEKITSSEIIAKRAKPFFEETKKISDYYKSISDILIETNTKIGSFKTSIASYGGIFGEIKNQPELSGISSKMTQAQVFLDQAKKDTEDIKNLSEKLNKTDSSALPKEAENYHQHNVKVLNTVTQYFTSVSGLMQSLITATNVIVDKAQNSQLTSGDSRMFSIVTADIITESEKADAKFVSDLQSLIGEETTLTLSFWQNNNILSSSGLVEKDIDDYDKTINLLRENSKIPVLTK